MEENNNPETPPPAPSYFIDEGIPGVGAKPEWLPDKYKTVADLAKAHSELEKKMGHVPEQYDISKSRFLDGEHDAIKDFLNTAKDKRVPKEVIDKMVDSLDNFMGQFDVDIEAERKKLGDDAPKRLEIIDNFYKANLSETAYKALVNNIQDADAISALDELRTKFMSDTPVIPSGNDQANNSIATVDSLKKEISDNYPRYKTDEKYRNDVNARMTVAVKATGMIDKHGN